MQLSLERQCYQVTGAVYRLFVCRYGSRMYYENWIPVWKYGCALIFLSGHYKESLCLKKHLFSLLPKRPTGRLQPGMWFILNLSTADFQLLPCKGQKRVDFQHDVTTFYVLLCLVLTGCTLTFLPMILSWILLIGLIDCATYCVM